MSANVEAMVREGINAFKAGRKDEARALLLKATELDQYNEQAWLWLSGLMDTPDDQRTCLENVLAINPNNERASQGLSYLTGQTSSGSTSPFSAGAPPPAPSPSAPTSVEWAAPEPTPAPWAQPAARLEPTPAALDDWVTNLNLQGGDPEDGFTFTPGGATASASPFGDDSPFGNDSPFGDFGVDDDAFDLGPFSSTPTPEEPESAPPAKRRSPTQSPRPPEGRRRSSPAPARSDTSLLYDIESARGDVDSESEGGMFGYIPAEIAPTRLPGTTERTPAPLMLGMVLLVALNIGAALLLMWGLLT